MPKPDLPTLKSLLDRVRSATGADRELDCDLFVATAQSPFVSYYPECVLATMGGFSARVEVSDIKPLTASIDAALELVERVRTDLRIWDMGQLVEKKRGRYLKAGWSCNLDSANNEAPGGECAEAPTPALAILSALLSALIAEAEHGD